MVDNSKIEESKVKEIEISVTLIVKDNLNTSSAKLPSKILILIFDCQTV